MSITRTETIKVSLFYPSMGIYLPKGDVTDTVVYAIESIDSITSAGTAIANYSRTLQGIKAPIWSQVEFTVVQGVDLLEQAEKALKDFLA